MSEELIDHYIDRAAVADDTKFMTDQLKTVLDLFDKVGSKKINLGGSKSMKDISTAAKELKQMLDALQKSTDTLLKTQLNEAKIRKETALAEKAEAQARKENAAAAQKEQQASDSATKSKANEQKVIDQIANEYLQLSKAYSDAALKAKNYALTLGENHPITIEAVKDAKAMHDILLRVDQSVGQSQRNVGNYKSAFDGLGVSFTQISRELPSLAISAQQFVLAISNNLPMVADEIKKAKDEIAALKSEGKEAPSIFQRIGGALISWQVGLSVGIALLTAYSGKIVEWASNLLDGSAAAKEAAKQQAELNERMEKGLDITEKYESLAAGRNTDFGNINRNLANQIAYAKAIGKEDTEVLKLERQLLAERQALASQEFFQTDGLKKLEELEVVLRKARDEYYDFTQTGIAFGKQLTFGGEEYKARETQLKAAFDHSARLYGDQKKIVQEFYDANRDLGVKDLELQRALIEQRAKFFADELQYRADILKKFSEVEEAQEITRVNARKQALKLESAIIEGQYADEIRAAKDNQTKIFEVNREFTFRRKKLQEDYERDILAIHQTSLQRRREQDQQDIDQFKQDQEDRLNKDIDNLQKIEEKRQLARVEGQESEIKALNKRYEAQVAATKEGSREREKVERDYAERRADIEYRYALAELKNQIEFAEKIVKYKKDNNQDVTADEIKLHELKMRLSDIETQHVIDNNKRQAKSSQEKYEDVKRGIDTIRSVYSETTAFIDGMLSASIDKQKNQIQDQIDDIDKKKEKEIESINATSQSQQDKAAAIALVEAKAAAQKEALERKQRQLDLQRARFEKMITIGRIIGDTAAAVVAALGAKPWTPANIATAIGVGAIGAGQLAVAIATPLPKFKRGRNGGPATWGVTGDGGKQEVVSSPDLSQSFVTPDIDTLTFIPKDWKVFPDVDSFQNAAINMVHKPLPTLPVIHNNNDGLIHAMAYEIGGLKRAILGKQETHFHWNNGELHKSIKSGDDWWRYIQNNI
jgi:hypothetical protein